MGLIILGIFLVLWGVACINIGILKPKKIWNIGKIQGFAKLLGNTGTTVFFIILGVASGAIGIVLLI